MYKNNFKNTKETDHTDLRKILTIFADSQKKIKLYAIGGTAMVIKGLKEVTKDIDFITTNDQEEIKSILKKSGFKENRTGMVNVWFDDNNLRLDIFYGPYIIGVDLEKDWQELSEFIEKLNQVELYVLNWYDIIITKIARSEDRDLEDIFQIMKTQKIDFKTLKKRYYDTADNSMIADHEYKFEHFEKKWHQQN